jgi:long-subunit acyl-CoA synthetase (AMP-forming)
MTTAATVANALAGLGYGDGSRIAILSETRPEFCELYVAA